MKDKKPTIKTVLKKFDKTFGYFSGGHFGSKEIKQFIRKVYSKAYRQGQKDIVNELNEMCESLDPPSTSYERGANYGFMNAVSKVEEMLEKEQENEE